MDFATVNKTNELVISKKILSIDYLKNNITTSLPIIGLPGYSLELKLNYNKNVIDIYNKLLENFPELTNVINKTIVSYGEYTHDNTFLFALMWIYKFYYNYHVVLFFNPKTLIYTLLNAFNETFIKDHTLFLQDHSIICMSLEAIENFNIKQPAVTIFGMCELTFADINQRRLNTQLKKIINKGIVHIFSYTSLTSLNCLQDIERYSFKNKPLINFKSMFDYISLIDLDEPYEDFIDLVQDLVKSGNRVYISLNLNVNSLKSIEQQIKSRGITTSRKDNPDSQVVINSSKMTTSVLLVHSYSVYILIFDEISVPDQIVNYLKFIGNDDCEIYFEASKIDNIEKCVLELDTTSTYKKTIIKESGEYQSYKLCKEALNDPDHVLANDYYLLEPSRVIQSLNLSNLKRTHYDLIRNYTKLQLLNEYSLELKTCQLSTPCSPIDRSKKLNSMTNKLSSVDYLCDITCEIFKDHSIGVLVWSDLFKTKNQSITGNYIFQTTSGKWKFATIK